MGRGRLRDGDRSGKEGGAGRGTRRGEGPEATGLKGGSEGLDANPQGTPCGGLECRGRSPVASESSTFRGLPPEQQAPMVLSCCVPYPSPARPRACPSPAFPGRSEWGVGNHTCCPGDSYRGGLGWAHGTLAQTGRRASIPTSASQPLELSKTTAPPFQGNQGLESQGPAPGMPEPELEPRPSSQAAWLSSLTKVGPHCVALGREHPPLSGSLSLPLRKWAQQPPGSFQP